MDTKGPSHTQLPPFFQTILWFYDFAALDPETHKKAIIVNAINYGDLSHWRWITGYYGKEVIRELLEAIPTTELRPRSRRLAEIIFHQHTFMIHPEALTERGKEIFAQLGALLVFTSPVAPP